MVKTKTTSPEIKLTDKLYLTMDPYNYILGERGTSEKTGKATTKNLGYYYNLEDLAKAAVKYDAKSSDGYTDAESLDDLINLVKASTTKIVKALKEQGLSESILKKY